MKQDTDQPAAPETVDELNDVTNHKWETDINLESEKQSAFKVLSNFVSHAEIYFNHHSASKTNEKHQRLAANQGTETKVGGRAVKQIKRFDPRNPNQSLIKEAPVKEKKSKEEKAKEKGFLEVLKGPTTSSNKISRELPQSKVVEISSTSWKEIMQSSKQEK